MARLRCLFVVGANRSGFLRFLSISCYLRSQDRVSAPKTLRNVLKRRIQADICHRVLWLGVALVIFANRVIPYTQNAGMFFVIVGGIITIIVIASMPQLHASNQFVWGSFEENNLTGWSSGVAFLLGVLNGAFTIGTPDAITHMAEELPHPKRDLPKAIALQIGLGFLCKPAHTSNSALVDTLLTNTWHRRLLLCYCPLIRNYRYQRPHSGY